MDMAEFFNAMYERRRLLRAQSRERYTLLRYKEFLERRVNPYLENKPKEEKDVGKFIWEMEEKQTVEEMKEVLLTIANTKFEDPKPRVSETRPPRIPIPKKKGPRYAG